MALNMTSGLRSAVVLTRQAVRSVSNVSKHSWEPKEVVTHTGQKWEANDYRLARFIDKEKQVNPSFAIDLVNQEPPIRCTKRVIFCDGGGGPLGHPKVYINLDKPGIFVCGYCGKRFYYQKDDDDDSH